MSPQLLRGVALGVGVAAALATAGPATASYTARVDAGTLRSTGDSASDKLVIYPSSVDLVVDVGMDGTADHTFPRSAFNAVSITGAGGDDEIRVVGGVLENLTVDGGAGNDTIHGGNGADTLIGGPGHDFVDGNQGADTVTLGAGNDTFQWDPGDGSDRVAGDGGTDTLRFNGSSTTEDIRLTADGAGARLTRNVANITTELAAIEQVNVRPLGAADTVTAGDLTGTGIRAVEVDLGVADGAADRVVATGTDGPDRAVLSTESTTGRVGGLAAEVRATNMEAADTLTAALAGGDDTAVSSAAPTGTVQVGVDGGAGTDSATYTGTADDDTISVVSNGTPVAAHAPGAPLFNVVAEQLTVKGGNGDDGLYALNGIARTALTLDGGNGDDTLRGGDGADLLLGGAGDDLLDSSFGADTLKGGSGNDTLQWDPGDGSDTLEGDSGTDTLRFNGANIGELITLTANGPRVRLTRNIANITLDADNVEAAAIRTLGGTDDVTIGDLTGTDLRTATVDLGGDGALDRVTAHGTDGPDRVTLGSDGAAALITGLKPALRVTGAEPQDVVTAALGGGDDTIAASAVPTGEARVDADGGPGTDTLTYTGTGDGDVITAYREGAVVRTYAPGAPNAGITAVEELTVKGGEANDTLVAINGIGTLTHFTADGGNGEDTLRGADGADLLLGGNGDDLIDGNGGADTARMGAGNDTYQWDPGDGSDVVDGQSGTDVLAFNGSGTNEVITASAAANRHVTVTRNVANIALDLANVEVWSVRPGAGTDTITVDDLGGTPLHTARIDLGADSQADTVTLNGTAKRDKVNVTREDATIVTAGLPAYAYITGSDRAHDTVRVNTLAGKDEVYVAPAVWELINPIVDLGADN